MYPTQNEKSQQASSQAPQREHQRFSWQAPLQREAPAYDERQPQYPQARPEQPRINTQDTSQRHFSYGQTPNELRAFVYTSSPSDPPLPEAMRISLAMSPYTPVDPQSQSLLYPEIPPAAFQPQNTYVAQPHAQDEKPPISPVTSWIDRPTSTFSAVSPMPQQYESAPTPQSEVQSRHARQMSNLAPINTSLAQNPMPPVPPLPSTAPQASPLPSKTPLSPTSAVSMNKDSTRSGPISPTYPSEPYSPHSFGMNHTNNTHAIFSPDAATGPNGLDFSLHQPGQIAHPNMDSERTPKWKNSLCGCNGDISTCLTGLICPCVVYGRTSYRLSQKSAKKDPTDMLGYSSTNGHCMMMGLSCGLWWLFPMLQRTRIRHAYKLEGDMGSDCAKGLCCCCCVAIQNDREVRTREEANRRWAGPASTDVYTRASGMVYKPQQ